RRQLLDDEAFQVLARDALLMTTEDASQREEALAECVKKLPREDRLLIERRYRGAQTPKQIADQSSRSVYSVYRALTRIHEALSKCIGQALKRESLNEANG